MGNEKKPNTSETRNRPPTHPFPYPTGQPEQINQTTRDVYISRVCNFKENSTDNISHRYRDYTLDKTNL